jgi:hypothetical protein
MATTGNNLPRKLNPQTGEWEVDQSQLTTQPVGGTTATGGGTGTNPNAPVTYNAPQVAGSNTYNPNGDFVQGGPNPATYASNVAASNTQTAQPPTTAPVGNSTLDWVNQMGSKYGLGNHDASYWVNAIDSNGGFAARDQAYWENRIKQGENYVGPGGSTATAPMLLPMMNANIQPFAGSNISANAAPQAEEKGWWNSDADPFQAVGGGVRLSTGLWVPASSPLAQGAKWSDVPTPTTTSGQTTTPTGTPNVTSEQAIQGLLNTPKTVDAQALAQSPENAAYRLGAQRAEERQRAQLAERAAANGTSESGGFENKLAGLRQARGEGESQFLGQLAITKMQQQREDLVNGIQFAMANQQFDKAQAMQRELAQLNASISREQLAMQGSIASNSLNENARQANNSLGYNYAALQQQGNQYLANLMLNGGG